MKRFGPFLPFLLVCMVFCQIEIEENIDPDVPYVTRERLERLKGMVDWQVYDYENHPFKDWTLNQLKTKVCNIHLGEVKGPMAPPEPEHILKQTPTNFDSRTQWPNCITPILDQGNCGDCWAFASTTVLGDRYCIQTSGATHVTLSPQHPNDCDTKELGCDGGYISYSWQWLASNGVVSLACYPYTSGQSGTAGRCNNSSCPGGGTWKKYYAGTAGAISSISDAKAKIASGGPIETGMQVYSDLYDYTSGIYQPRSGSLLGGHAVRIVGYGVSSGINYWIVANSWGTSWGEQGYFRIKQGTSQIEGELYYGTANTSKIESYDYDQKLAFLIDQ